jgi:hypothetical protein
MGTTADGIIGSDDSMELEPVEIGELNPDIEVILDLR